MDDELEDIQLDFESSELELQVEQYGELLSSSDICDIECLGSPFLPKCQRNSCPCDMLLRNQSKERLSSNQTNSPDSTFVGEEQDNRLKLDVGEVKDHRLKLDVSSEDPAEIRRRNASLHLDEFLLELLNKGGYEAYIHWTVRERKEFKITRPQRIAALWGDRKSRKMMTDEKLLRAIRYYIRKGRVQKADSQNLLFRFSG